MMDDQQAPSPPAPDEPVARDEEQPEECVDEFRKLMMRFAPKNAGADWGKWP